MKLILTILLFATTINAQIWFPIGLDSARISETNYFPEWEAVHKPSDLSYENGLVAAYNMIPTSGSTIDISGNGNDGTINGAMQTRESLSFDGVDDYVQRTAFTELNNTNSYSINIRFKMGDLAGAQMIIANGNGATDRMSLLTNSSSLIYENYDGSTYTGTSVTIQSDTWYNVTCVSIANTKTLYVNGAKVIGGSSAGLSGNNITNFVLGADGTLTSRTANMEVSDFMLYNRALTETEIVAYHNSFADDLYFTDTFEDDAVGNSNPESWMVESGSYAIAENDRKYFKNTSDGIASIFYNQSTSVDASIDFYNGSTWATLEDTLSTLITTYAWLSQSGSKLSFDLDTNEGVANIVIRKGISQ